MAVAATCVFGVQGGAAQRPGSQSISLDSLLAIPISAAARYEQTTAEAAASITLVTREDIEAYGFRSIWEILASLRGFHATYDRVYEYIGFRGFGRPSDNNNRILLMVDGRPTNDVMTSAANLAGDLQVPIEHVERVEVVRGPGSALYGSSAMLAVVNVVTRSGDLEGGTRVTADAGSYGLLRGALSFSGKLGGGATLSAFAAAHGSDGPDLFSSELAATGRSDGFARGQNYRSGADIGGTLRVGDVELVVSADRQEQGDPNAPFGSTPAGPNWRRGHGLRVDVRLDRELTHRVGLLTSTSFLDYHSDIRLSYDDPVPDRTASLLGRRAGGEAQLRIDVSPAARLVVGGEARRMVSGISSGSVAPVDFPSIGLMGGFAQYEWQARADLSLVVGVRGDHYSRSGSALSPRGAVVFHASEAATFKAMFGRAFRAPTPLEQFLEEPGVLERNPDLEPERIRTMEVVWEQRLAKGLRSTVSAYDFAMTSLISQGVLEGRSVLTYQNLDEVHGRGVSGEIDGRFSGGRMLSASLVVQRGENRGVSAPLANSPSYLARVRASAPLLAGVRAGVLVQRDGMRHTLLGAHLPGYTVASVHLTHAVSSGMRASVTVFNLFGTEYVHPGGPEHIQQSIPQDGRTFRISLRATF